MKLQTCEDLSLISCVSHKKIVEKCAQFEVLTKKDCNNPNQLLYIFQVCRYSLPEYDFTLEGNISPKVVLV